MLHGDAVGFAMRRHRHLLHPQRPRLCVCPLVPARPDNVMPSPSMNTRCSMLVFARMMGVTSSLFMLASGGATAFWMLSNAPPTAAPPFRLPSRSNVQAHPFGGQLSQFCGATVLCRCDPCPASAASTTWLGHLLWKAVPYTAEAGGQFTTACFGACPVSTVVVRFPTVLVSVVFMSIIRDKVMPFTIFEQNFAAHSAGICHHHRCVPSIPPVPLQVNIVI